MLELDPPRGERRGGVICAESPRRAKAPRCGEHSVHSKPAHAIGSLEEDVSLLSRSPGEAMAASFHPQVNSISQLKVQNKHTDFSLHNEDRGNY